MQEKVRQLLARISVGVLPAMATPLHDDGYHVNVDALGPLTDLLIGAGVKGLFVGGTTGEGLVLSIEQRKLLHEQAIRVVDGRVPVLVHAGSNTTAETIELAQHAEKIGADAIVIITPTFFGMPDSALAAYFEETAAAVPGMPLFVYDIPHMAINGVSPGLLQSLGRSIPALAGVKSSRADAQIVRQLIDAAPEGTIVLVGNERIALGALAMGAGGLISGLATAIPEPFVSLTEAFAAGDLEAARAEQQRINRLLDRMPAGARIGAIKEILQQRGIDIGPPVPPRPAANCPDLWQELKQLL